MVHLSSDFELDISIKGFYHQSLALHGIIKDLSLPWTHSERLMIHVFLRMDVVLQEDVCLLVHLHKSCQHV